MTSDVRQTPNTANVIDVFSAFAIVVLVLGAAAVVLVERWFVGIVVAVAGIGLVLWLRQRFTRPRLLVGAESVTVVRAFGARTVDLGTIDEFRGGPYLTIHLKSGERLRVGGVGSRIIDTCRGSGYATEQAEELNERLERWRRS